MKLTKVILGGLIFSCLGTATTLYLLNKRKTTPKGIIPLKPFNINKFLGKWYEIARIDFFFEKYMDNVIAEYSLNFDGSLRVVNSGYNYKKKKYKISAGRAIYNYNNEGKLLITFFGKIYSGFNIISIDDEYKYALVTGNSRKYLWILSREKEMPLEIIEDFLIKAHNLNYDISKLVWTNHS